MSLDSRTSGAFVVKRALFPVGLACFSLFRVLCASGLRVGLSIPRSGLRCSNLGVPGGSSCSLDAELADTSAVFDGSRPSPRVTF